MDWREPSVKVRCGLCKQKGHNNWKCLNTRKSSNTTVQWYCKFKLKILLFKWKFFVTLKMGIELFPYNVIGMSCNKLMKLFKWCREYILMDLGLVDCFVLYNQEVHWYSLTWEENDHGELHCRRCEANLYCNSVLDAHIIPYLQQSRFYGVARLGFI